MAADELDELLGIDPNNPLDRLAGDLVRADFELMASLRLARMESGLTHEQVAERMGTTAEKVWEFEAINTDPRLSTIRRYALAVGARVEHAVFPDPLAADTTDRETANGD